MADPEQNKGQAPLDFSREKEREVAMQARPSLFCILVDLRKHHKEDMRNNSKVIEKYTQTAKNVAEADRGQGLPAGAIKANARQRLSTGFAVASNDIRLRILTCAHTIADVYTRGIHSAFTLDELNSLFKFEVHCVHQEDEVRSMVSKKMISARTRYSTPANVVAINTKLDLMVLEIEAGELVLNLDHEGYQDSCDYKHPVIHLANANPRKMQKLVMAGWPPQRSFAAVTGQVSECDWTYDAVSGLNSKGYTMKLLEVDGMVGDSGFSGSPVLDGNCHYVGVYHGVFHLSMGYAVSLEDVKAFLQTSGMLTFAPEQGVKSSCS